MARFIQAQYPTQHGGVVRVEQALEAIRGYNTTHVVLHGLAVLGTPLTRLTARVRAGLAAWREERKQREEDRKLWNLALTDARVMADLSRAMSREASDIARYY